ncbi:MULTISPECIES: hypothetical protein [Mannheimia]|uniref:Uncharacterized protein n=1 Tax=Mannheimia pernigra TaxID=111844 RepID=A0A7D5HT31_9PAST|nr:MULTISPECIES: hypothetical protein [Mannheimia]QLB39736.1 hypothetical protein HV559_01945 [Mannheimia pernigra]QLB41772.1 hypothetical protein HV560_02420 [Mannheimia pernigra]QTM01000.1 hypothetical protein GM698_05000 [Mannheimia sp. ZY171111]
MAKIFLLIVLVLVAFIGGNYVIGNNEKKEEKVEAVEPTKTESQQTVDPHKELEVKQPQPLPAVTKEEKREQAKDTQNIPAPSKQQALPEEQSLEGQQQQQPAEVPQANQKQPEPKTLANEQKPETHAKTLEHTPTAKSTGVGSEGKPLVQQTTPEELSKAIGQKEPTPHKEQGLPEEQSLEGQREQKATQQPETNKQ